MRIYLKKNSPNFTTIRCEATEPWAFLKRLPQQKQQEEEEKDE